MATVSRIPKVPDTISQVSDGDRTVLLRALRRRVAAEIDDGCPAAYLAPLVRQMRDLSAEIDALESVGKGDDVSAAAVTPDAPWAG